MASIWRRHRNHIHKLVMGLGSKSQVRFGFKQCILGSVWVQVAKRSGFPPGFSVIATKFSLRVGFLVEVWIFTRVLGFQVRVPITSPHMDHFLQFSQRDQNKTKNSRKHNFYHYNNTDLREHFASISWTGHLHFTKTTIFRSGGQRPKSNCPFVRPIPAVMVETVKHWVVQIVLR